MERFSILTIVVGLLLGLSLESRAQPTPLNDDFGDADPLESLWNDGTTEGASIEIGEPNHLTSGTAIASVWYRWTPPEDGIATFGILGRGGSDHVAVIYSGNSLSSLQQLTSTDTFRGVTISVTAFTTISVVVASEEAGRYTLNHLYTPNSMIGGPGEEFPPINDGLEFSWPIGPLPEFLPDETTTNATRQSGEPRHSNSVGLGSVWYRWTATSVADVFLTVENPTFRSTLAVYKGGLFNATVGELELVSRDWNLNIGPVSTQFTAVTNQSYYIVVESSRRGTGGRFGLNMVSHPSYDTFENAFKLEADVAVNSENSTATSEVGEPDHNGLPARQSLWYSFTTGTAEAYRVKVISNSGSHHYAAYRGTDIINLEPCELLEPRSDEFVLREAPGTELRIAVDSEAGNEGDIFIVIEPVELAYTVWKNSIADFPPGADGQEDDPDKDGWANVIEMLLGMDPLSANPSEHPTIAADGGWVEFVYNRVFFPHDSVLKPRLIVEISADLETWSEVFPSSLLDGRNRVRSSLSLVPTRYIRFRSEQP